MEENVALDSTKQKKFVKGIKKLIKKSEKDPGVLKPVVTKTDDDKPKKKRFIKEKGLVYLSHIPHGFYEHQMTQYFKQFGRVTNARVIRSQKTGNSKGFAFVEFAEPAVAQIVAETMNNYLMDKRLIKAEYVPPEKQKRAMRKHWSNTHNPGQELQMKLKKTYNADKSDDEELKRAKKILSNLNKTKKKLGEIGIDYDFFTAVDIPEEILKTSATVVSKPKPTNLEPPTKKTKTTEVSSVKKIKKNKTVEVPAVKQPEPETKQTEVPSLKKPKANEKASVQKKIIEVATVKKSKQKSIEKNEKVTSNKIQVRSILKRKK